MIKNYLKKFCFLSSLVLLPLTSVLATPTTLLKATSIVMSKEQPELKEFVSLIEARLNLAKDLGVYKWNNKVRIDEPEKESAYLEKIGQEAEALGVDEDLALSFYVSLNDATKDIHIDQFEQWIMSDVHVHANSPDGYILEKQLEDADKRLLSSLKDLEPLLQDAKNRAFLESHLSTTLKDKGFSRHVIDSVSRFID